MDFGGFTWFGNKKLFQIALKPYQKAKRNLGILEFQFWVVALL